MKPLHLIVSSIQPVNRADPGAPIRVVLVSADPDKPQQISMLIHDRADLEGLELHTAVDLTLSLTPQAPASVASAAPAPPKAS